VMANFNAVVSFIAFGIEADTREEADKKVNELIDELGEVDTVTAWDSVECVEWVLFENENEEVM